MPRPAKNLSSKSAIFFRNQGEKIDWDAKSSNNLLRRFTSADVVNFNGNKT